MPYPIPDLSPEAARFVAMFSRLEYAMKRCPEFRRTANGFVEADWTAFQDCPEIANLYGPLCNKAEAQELVDLPPKQRVLSGNALAWGPQPPKCPDMPAVVRGLKNVRNNLFHGEKGAIQVPRDVRLYAASIVVMDAMLERGRMWRKITFSNVAQHLPREIRQMP